MRRIHNGYVRQGWILLINPTGYIVPSCATDIPDFSSHSASFPKKRRRFSSRSCRCQPVPRPSILRASTSGTRERAVSFCRDELCRRARCLVCASLLYHSHYARLRQRRYWSAAAPRCFLRLEEDDVGSERTKRDAPPLRGTTVRRLPRSRSLAGGGRCTI